MVIDIRRGNRGFSLIEVTVATALMAVVLLMAVNFVTSARSQARTAQERSFAVQKGISLIEEVRNFTQQVGDFAELDSLDDGILHNNVLTIQNGTTPNHVISGNIGSVLTPSGWQYSRRLVVRPFAGLDIRDLRIVSALVYREEPGGTHTLLADVGTVLRSPGDQVFPTAQTYDVYFLALENIPGWWVYMSYIKPLMEVTVEDLQARNPGLNFRAHWIAKSSYGRNQRYMPYINESLDSYQDINWAYFYPGTMPAGESADEYYVPGQISARMNVDGADRNGYDQDLNPLPYTLADEDNHGMRYIDELKYFNQRCSLGLEDPMAPTWRIMLEKMSTDPDAFENAIVINLHGELLPMPAIRNFSDPAKEPGGNPGVRVVTHPEYLRTPATHDLRLRVYAFYDLCDEQLGAPPNTIPETSLVIYGADLTGDILVERIYGGVDGSGGAPGTLYGRDAAPVIPTGPTEMYYKSTSWDVDGDGANDTVITLYETPLICPQDVNGRGLHPDWRLYGLDYIPSSTEAAGDFSRNLTDPNYYPKNTARWIITVPQAACLHVDVQKELSDPHDGVDDVVNRLTFDTRIGSDLTTGVMWLPDPLPDPIPAAPQTHFPENLSRTYAWWTNDTGQVPFSERSQFIGDPRHCPYADLKDAAPVLSFRNGYNWWFDNFKDGAYGNAINQWQGYETTRIQNDEGDNDDGWAYDHMRIDVPRYMELIRNGLVTTDSVYTTLTGWSYYYMAIGGEIGYDSANGFAKGIPVSRKPFYGTGGQRTEQTISSASPDDGAAIGTGMKVIKRITNPMFADYWWAKPWIGELFPDAQWPQWQAAGNLLTGTDLWTFLRVKREAITRHLPRGTTFTLERRRLRHDGCNTFFLVGTRESTFDHTGNSNNGTLTGTGDEIASDYAFPLPTSTLITRPFRIDWVGSGTWRNDDFDYTTDFPHNTAEIVRTYYTHPWSAPLGQGSALVALTDPTNSHSSFQVINGLAQTIESGSAFIARWSVLSLVHSFLTAGEPATAAVAANRIEQLPRAEIRHPTIITALEDPLNITVQWSTEFLRWDREKYSQYYPDGFTEATWMNNLRYVLMYSPDTGQTWYYMEDDAFAVPQEAKPEARPSGALAGYLKTDIDPIGDEFFNWATPEDLFPEGSYLIRVEVYREERPFILRITWKRSLLIGRRFSDAS